MTDHARLSAWRTWRIDPCPSDLLCLFCVRDFAPAANLVVTEPCRLKSKGVRRARMSSTVLTQATRSPWAAWASSRPFAYEACDLIGKSGAAQVVAGWGGDVGR